MIAYLDLPAGVSGDMLLGCLVDAGWPIDQLRLAIAKLKLPTEEWAVERREVMKGAIRATLVDVQAAEGHVHRGMAEIRGIIEGSDHSAAVKQKAMAVFTRLGQAEAKVHGTTLEAIHFHEVGAVDAIIDIVGVVAGLEELGVSQVFASALPLGHGWGKMAHGTIPLPAPATLEILAAAKAPVRPAPGPGEHVTPTGAALVAELATFEQPSMTLEKIALGAGQRECAWPNVARMWLGTLQARGGMVKLETNIDDMNPQLFAAVSEQLFAAGAKDVWFTPIQMKKNRPAVMLSALAPAAKEMELSQVMLRETTTLGVRVEPLSARHEAQRAMRSVATPFGEVAVKVKILDGKMIGAMPEYDECRKLAAAANVPVRAVWEAASAAAQGLL